MTMYKNLTDFLIKHRTKEKHGITHTRIGNGKDILPGKYIIPNEDYDIFLKLYNKHVFVDKKDEYLTETQSKEGNGPILIDLDFRFDKSIKTRQYTKEHIEDFVILCLDKMNNLLEVPEDNKIRVFILEKDNVNTKDEKYTKDGVHIVINVKMNHILQCILREEVLKNMDDVFADLPLANSYEEVFDDGISKGHTNWQMYGSKKPNNEAYKLKVKREMGNRNVSKNWHNKNENTNYVMENLLVSKTPPLDYTNFIFQQVCRLDLLYATGFYKFE
jgi:hypothetical protein